MPKTLTLFAPKFLFFAKESVQKNHEVRKEFHDCKRYLQGLLSKNAIIIDMENLVPE